MSLIEAHKARRIRLILLVAAPGNNDWVLPLKRK